MIQQCWFGLMKQVAIEETRYGSMAMVYVVFHSVIVVIGVRYMAIAIVSLGWVHVYQGTMHGSRFVKESSSLCTAAI